MDDSNTGTMNIPKGSLVLVLDINKWYKLDVHCTNSAFDLKKKNILVLHETLSLGETQKGKNPAHFDIKQ